MPRERVASRTPKARPVARSAGSSTAPKKKTIADEKWRGASERMKIRSDFRRRKAGVRTAMRGQKTDTHVSETEKKFGSKKGWSPERKAGAIAKATKRIVRKHKDTEKLVTEKNKAREATIQARNRTKGRIHYGKKAMAAEKKI